MLLRIRLLFGLMILLAVAALLIACGGVSQSDYDAAKQALTAQDQRVQSLQAQLSAKEKQIADLQKAPAAAPTGKVSGITWQAKPTFTPAPPPTPLPAGVTPPPRPGMPASYLDPVPYVFYVETLTSGAHPSKYGLQPTQACVLSGVFKRGTKIVWRFEVIDTATGKRITDKDTPTVKIKIPGADELTGRFSARGGLATAPWMWAAGWDIPPDYPIGALDYQIVVTTKDGKSATWKVPALVNPQTSSDSRVQIVD